MELQPLPEKDWVTLINKTLAYGNHMSATKTNAELLTILNKEMAPSTNDKVAVQNPRPSPHAAGTGGADHN